MGQRLKNIMLGSMALFLFSCSSDSDQFTRFITHLKDVPAKERNTVVTQYAKSQTWPFVEKGKVYFLMKAQGANKVSLIGDMNGWKPDSTVLMNIPGTEYFFVEQYYPEDTRLEYKYMVNGKFILDPLNPKVSKGGFAENSILLMPEYIFPSHILIQREAYISRLDTINFYSRKMDNSRVVYLYLHPHAREDSPLIFFHDGSDYLKFGRARIILDNLIAAGTIPPVKAAFVDPVDRMKEYWFRDDYLKMIFDELLPDIRKQAHVGDEAKLVMGGVSLGGLVSFFALANYAEQIHGIFSQSGAIWIEQEKILDLIGEVSSLTNCIYFDYGSFEKGIITPHKKLETILKNKKISFKSNVYNEGHNWASWRAHLPQALSYCLIEELEE